MASLIYLLRTLFPRNFYQKNYKVRVINLVYMYSILRVQLVVQLDKYLVSRLCESLNAAHVL